MPDYRVRASGEVISDLVHAFPNVSIPQPPSLADLNDLGVDPILEGPQPPLTRFQYAVRSGPTQINGQWFWVYTAEDMTPEQIQQLTDQQWQSVRNERDSKLQECDWTQLPDVPLTAEQKAEWVTYRQQLRDVTNQPDPFNITWPVAPQA